MKTKILLLLIFALPFCGMSQRSIQAYLSYATFVSPQDGPYVETYLSILAKSLHFTKQENGKFQGSVGITMIFKQGEVVKDFKKYELKSPEVADTNNLNFSFIDQQRFLLANGEYTFDFQIQDNQLKSEPLKTKENFVIDYPKEKVGISGIQLVESFKETTQPNILTKNGYDLVPYIANFYPSTVNKLTFYTEVYNTDKQLGADSKYLISCYIKSSETDKKLNDYIKNKKETSKPVNIVFQEMNIEKLPSGNYYLAVEVRNQQNELVAENSLFFQRSNPNVHLDLKDIQVLDIQNSFVAKYTRKDSLAEFIRSTDPIATDMERMFIESQLKNMDIQTMQQYFLNFWEKRDPASPEKAWNAYNEEVIKANEAFRTPIKKGYATDRGRIYLKYGPPNTISDVPFDASSAGMEMSIVGGSSPGNVPYQIWHYYQLKNNQRDKKFVFANPSLATNDYALIHSNAIGEVNNPNWQKNLQRQMGILDKEEIVTPGGQYGTKSGELYNNPH